MNHHIERKQTRTCITHLFFIIILSHIIGSCETDAMKHDDYKKKYLD